MKLIYSFIIITFFQTALYSQSFLSNNISALVKEFQKSSVSFEVMDSSLDFKKSKPILIGSGFLVIKNQRKFAITNAHVRNAVPKNMSLIIGMNTDKGKFYGVLKFVKEDIKKDIAVYEYFDYGFSEKNIKDSTIVNQTCIGISYFAKASEIIPGISIISIGYPLNIGSDFIENNPVIRSGMVAQKVLANGMFLIDGMSNPGNSGSPVFDVENVKLIGMISNGPNDRIQAFDSNGELIVTLPYNSGLTYCISVSEILKLIP